MTLIQIYSVAERGLVERETINRTESNWRESLSPEVFFVARKGGTEPPFSGRYHDCHETGIYTCVCCGTDLFNSDEKYDSGTGWPSFKKPVSEHNISIQEDRTGGMVRDEVLCVLCTAHLGHVFNDGPPPDGLRFCMNSLSLRLKREI